MKPEKENMTPPAMTITQSGLESVAHLLSNPASSSRETIMFILATQKFGQNAANQMAAWLGWDVKLSASDRAAIQYNESRVAQFGQR